MSGRKADSGKSETGSSTESAKLVTAAGRAKLAARAGRAAGAGRVAGVGEWQGWESGSGGVWVGIPLTFKGYLYLAKGCTGVSHVIDLRILPQNRRKFSLADKNQRH